MSPQPPSISVVIPAYNAERFLAQTLDSLLAQTFRDFELIIVDDGSADRTMEIAQQYERKDPRVIAKQIPHGGLVEASNACLHAARAELIARADADDIHLPDRLEKQAAFLAQHPEVIAVGSRMLMIEPYGSPLETSKQKLTHEEIEADLLAGIGSAMPNPASMVRKTAALQIGGYRKDYFSEDTDFFLRMAEIGKLANLPDVLVKYRIHPTSWNWHNYQRQLEDKPRLIAEAYARRGKTMPQGLNFDHGGKTPKFDRYVSFGWICLYNQNPHGARMHALSALREKPYHPKALKLALRAMIGR